MSPKHLSKYLINGFNAENVISYIQKLFLGASLPFHHDNKKVGNKKNKG